MNAKVLIAAIVIATVAMGIITADAYVRGRSTTTPTVSISITTTTKNSDTSTPTTTSTIITTQSESTTPPPTTSSSSSSSGSTSTDSRGSTTTTSTTTTTDSPSESSAGNACFTNGYNANVSIIDAYYYECSAKLDASQSMKQFMLRSSLLYGTFELSINSSQSVTVTIAENGAIVFSETGTSILYSGSIGQNELMSVTISNSASNDTTYELGLRF